MRIVSMEKGVFLHASENLVPGIRIEAGQVLGQVVPHMQQSGRTLLESEFQIAWNTWQTLKRQRTRMEELAKAKLESAEQVERATLEERTASARVNELGNRLSRLRKSRVGNPDTQEAMQVLSPLSGVLQDPVVPHGATVQEGDLLFHVMDSDRLQLRISVFEQDVPDPSRRVRGWFSALGSSRRETFDLTAGQVRWSQRVNAGSNTVFAHVPMDDRVGRFFPGQKVMVHLLSEEIPIPAVPAGAIIRDGFSRVVLVRSAPDRFVRKTVQTGRLSGGFVEVTHGLKEGEEVVVENPLALHYLDISAGLPESAHVH